MMNDVLFSYENQVGIITLNRPHAFNALTFPMILAIQKQLQAWSKSEAIAVVVIKSDLPKVFCAGGDVRWLYEAGPGNHHEQMQFFWHEYRLNYFIHQFNKPYVALMDGLTMGGGVGVALHGRYRVASERFVFAMPETGIGFFPDIGASYLLSRMPKKLGIYLGLTGHRLNAQQARLSELVDYQVPSSSVADIFSTLVNTTYSHEAHEEVARTLASFQIKTTETDTSLNLSAIEHCFSPSSLEAIIDRLITLDNEWARETLSTLALKSPRSLKITLRQLNAATHLSLADCLKMDYALVWHFMQDQDFYEGVRALLVDKDKSPKWQEDSIETVLNMDIDSYFECGEAPLELLLHP